MSFWWSLEDFTGLYILNVAKYRETMHQVDTASRGELTTVVVQQSHHLSPILSQEIP
uniref:Uncharacterized protein n=1 Tax=Anguilla anguilla TaxID=7936 RepID=A0A0E9R8P1_ANGAN